MCVDTKRAFAMGMAALTATTGTRLAASLRAKVHEWSPCNERRPARRPPAACRPPDVFELGVPVELQRAQPQLVDGQLAIEVIEVVEHAPGQSVRIDPWDLAPGDSALHGLAIARSVAWCDAIDVSVT